jgi:outer membrane protein assembly factor BamE (lipoprotein component of BamABCDE complex)
MTVSRLLVAFVVALLMIGFVYYFAYQNTRPHPSNAAIAKLQQGMSTEAIQQHIGPPNARQIIDGLETWWYYDPAKAQNAIEPKDIAYLVITFDRENKLHEMKFMER